jgi:methionyl-tRNA formyltransferase
MNDLRIVFMGTPEFAVATLGSLLMNGYNVVGVVTAPDKPAGRGQKLSRSAVREFCDLSSLPFLQPVSLKDPEFLRLLGEFKADIFIVVAFRMLPEAVWKMAPMGTINLHASLLPHYRGAAPINHVLMNGEIRTGVTTFFIDDKIDTGNLLMREEVQIFPNENAGDLHNRLMKAGARLMIRTLRGLADKTINPIPQSQFLKPGEIPELAPKIFPADCIINWERNNTDVHNQIRGLSPYPCARTSLRNGESRLSLKIYESYPDNEPQGHSPGHIISDGKQYMKIVCGKGALNIVSLQLEGKKRMGIQEFLRGFRISGFMAEVTQQA